MDLIIVLISSWAHDSPELLYIIASLQLQNFPEKGKKEKIGIQNLSSCTQQRQLQLWIRYAAGPVCTPNRLYEIRKKTEYRKQYNTRILLISARLWRDRWLLVTSYAWSPYAWTLRFPPWYTIRKRQSTIQIRHITVQIHVYYSFWPIEVTGMHSVCMNSTLLSTKYINHRV